MNTSKKRKSILLEAENIALSKSLFSVGARIQVVQDLLMDEGISYDRLSNLFREVNGGKSASKGMLPSDGSWHLSWEGKIHSLLFYSYYQKYRFHSDLTKGWALFYAYLDYHSYAFSQGNLATRKSQDGQVYMSITRAWLFLRLLDIKIIELYDCSECGMPHLKHSYETASSQNCLVYKIPSRIKKDVLKKENEL